MQYPVRVPKILHWEITFYTEAIEHALYDKKKMHHVRSGVIAEQGRAIYKVEDPMNTVNLVPIAAMSAPFAWGPAFAGGVRQVGEMNVQPPSLVWSSSAPPLTQSITARPGSGPAPVKELHADALGYPPVLWASVVPPHEDPDLLDGIVPKPSYPARVPKLPPALEKYRRELTHEPDSDSPAEESPIDPDDPA